MQRDEASVHFYGLIVISFLKKHVRDVEKRLSDREVFSQPQQLRGAASGDTKACDHTYIFAHHRSDDRQLSRADKDLNQGFLFLSQQQGVKREGTFDIHKQPLSLETWTRGFCGTGAIPNATGCAAIKGLNRRDMHMSVVLRRENNRAQETTEEKHGIIGGDWGRLPVMVTDGEGE